jgi:ABC transporter family protein/helix-turn-helix protein
MLESTGLHPGRTARDHLRVRAVAGGIPARRVPEALDLVDLTADAGRRIGGFSLGMRQRLGLASAPLGDPEVLILDEPANGLDPDGVRWLRGLLKDLAGAGRTVLVPSHALAEVVLTADHVVVIDHGRLVTDTARDAFADDPARFRLGPTAEPQRLTQIVAEHGGATTARGDRLEIVGLTSEQDRPARPPADRRADHGLRLGDGHRTDRQARLAGARPVPAAAVGRHHGRRRQHGQHAARPAGPRRARPDHHRDRPLRRCGAADRRGLDTSASAGTSRTPDRVIRPTGGSIMFGPDIAAGRRRLNLTQEGLAERTGLSVRAIRNLESGSVTPAATDDHPDPARGARPALLSRRRRFRQLPVNCLRTSWSVCIRCRSVVSNRST